MIQESEQTAPSFTVAKNGFFQRLRIVASQLPRMIRDAWRDSRYPYEFRISSYGNFFYENPNASAKVWVRK